MAVSRSADIRQNINAECCAMYLREHPMGHLSRVPCSVQGRRQCEARRTLRSMVGGRPACVTGRAAGGRRTGLHGRPCAARPALTFTDIALADEAPDEFGAVVAVGRPVEGLFHEEVALALGTGRGRHVSGWRSGPLVHCRSARRRCRLGHIASGGQHRSCTALEPPAAAAIWPRAGAHRCSRTRSARRRLATENRTSRRRERRVRAALPGRPAEPVDRN